MEGGWKDGRKEEKSIDFKLFNHYTYTCQGGKMESEEEGDRRVGGGGRKVGRITVGKV